jgi:tetratricopeptide (TPR) repeat protein
MSHTECGSNMDLTIEQALHKAIEAHNLGNLQDAERLYRFILQVQPQHPDANHNLGVVAVSVNRPEIALPLFKTAFEVKPSQGQFWLSYIDALIKEKQFDNAKDIISQGKKAGLREESVHAYELQIAQFDVDLLGGVPNTNILSIPIELREEGKYQEAQYWLKNFLNTQQSNAEGWSLLSQVYLLDKRDMEAEKALAEAISINSNLPSIYRNQARLLLKKSKPNEALESAKIAYDKSNEDPENWIVLAACLGANQKDQDALILVESALKAKPNYAEAFAVRAMILLRVRNISNGIEDLETAVSLKPHLVQLWGLLGSLRYQSKNLVGAIEALEKAHALEPTNVNYMVDLGEFLRQDNRGTRAISLLNDATKLEPKNANAWTNLGAALQQDGKIDDAKLAYQEAWAINANSAEILNNLGRIEIEAGKWVSALQYFEKAITIKPDLAEAHSNLGITLKAIGRLEEAATSYRKAIAIKPDFAEAHNNLGSTFNELGRLKEAEASYKEAIAIKPEFADAHYNLGIILKKNGRLIEAETSYNKSIAIEPEFADALYNRGLLRLVLRDFYNGFIDYKYRWDSKDFPGKYQKTTIPSSSKSEFKGRLLIWAEQGLGDEIFYAGLLPMLSKKDVSIALSADKRLHSIYQRSFPKIDLLDKKILMNSSIDTGFDAQAPIGDLGFLLDIDTAAIQVTRSPYLMSDHVKRDSYRRTISAFGSGLVCGVAWKSVNQKFGSAKSIKLNSFEPLLGLSGVHFVNLQYGDVKEEIRQVKSTFSVDVHQVPGVDVFNDIDSLLALIDACDVIVTTSNVTAHLAGSIGKRAAVLVPHSTGKIWYWHENDEYSFWYPSLKMFYQDNTLTWEQTIEDCSGWLKSLL